MTDAVNLAEAVYNEEGDIHGFTHNKSSDDGKVRLYQKGDEYYIAHRGTKLGSLSDFKSDLLIGTGEVHRDKQHIERSETTAQYIREIREIDPQAKIHLTGHSLGGSTVAFALQDPFISENITQAHVFNAGTSPLNFLTADIYNHPKLNVNHVEGDPISSGTGRASQSSRLPLVFRALDRYDLFGVLNHSIKNFF